MELPVAYSVPLELLECKKGHLVALRAHLEAIGYPLANNIELNAPDSIIRLQEGYKLVGTKAHSNHKTYYVARVDNESSENQN